MDRSSNKYVIFAIIAGLGLLLVLCGGLAVALLIVNLGEKRLAGPGVIEAVDRIAFVSLDNNLYLVDRRGENVEHLAAGEEGAVLSFPTWSPDGRQVAYLAQRVTDDEVESALYTVSTGGDDSVELYASADNPAFYLYWSPDSRYVSFLTQEDAGLALRLAPADGRQNARILDRGSPFYWSWSPDGSELIMHIGGARRFSEDARLAILSNQPDSTPAMLDDAPANFQSPTWSPDGNWLLYASEDENGEQALHVHERASGVVEKLADVPGFVGFNWSPDGKWIAYQQIEDPRVAPLGHVFVMPAPQNSDPVKGESGSDQSEGVPPNKENEARQVSRDLALGFFWSPDGQHLAVLVPSLEEEGPSTRMGSLAAPLMQEQQLLLRWWVADMPDGELRPLVAFRPTRAFLLIIPYFDQYAQSIRFWSPDSRYLVYSHREAPGEAGVWVADVEGQEPPRRLADGTLAVWSWQ